MPTYPPTRRVFGDPEYLNENAAIATIVRSLAQWQNYTYGRDLKVSPADAKVYADIGWPWASGKSWTPWRSFGSGSRPTGGVLYPAGGLAQFVALDPRGPYRQVAVYFCISRAAAGAIDATVTVTNANTGESATLALPDAGTLYWRSINIPASAGDVLQLSASWTSGTNFDVLGYTAFWARGWIEMPAGTTIPDWSPMSQAWVTDGRPLSTQLLRWLGRSSNAFLAQKPPTIASAWFGYPAAGTGSGYTYNASSVVGRYALVLSPVCPTLRVRVAYRASGACSVLAAFAGGGPSVTLNIAGVGTGWVEGTISMPTPYFGSSELVFTVQGAPQFCDVEVVTVYEEPATAASLALPGLETVPSAFVPIADERITSGSDIKQADLAQMVRNMVWLWAYRRDRVLVNDCRATYPEGTASPFTGPQGLADTAALHVLKTSKRNAGDALGEIQVRAGWHAGSGSQAPTSWEPWRFQVGITGSGDSPGCPPRGAAGQASDFPYQSFDAHEMAVWQHAPVADLAAETVLQFATLLPTADHTTGIPKSTRPSWLVLEELPIGTAAIRYNHSKRVMR